MRFETFTVNLEAGFRQCPRQTLLNFLQISVLLNAEPQYAGLGAVRETSRRCKAECLRCFRCAYPVHDPLQLRNAFLIGIAEEVKRQVQIRVPGAAHGEIPQRGRGDNAAENGCTGRVGNGQGDE